MTEELEQGRLYKRASFRGVFLGFAKNSVVMDTWTISDEATVMLGGYGPLDQWHIVSWASFNGRTGWEEWADGDQ